MLAKGDQIDPYRVRRLLGTGSVASEGVAA
jgi:hypothetical protein